MPQFASTKERSSAIEVSVAVEKAGRGDYEVLLRVCGSGIAPEDCQLAGGGLGVAPASSGWAFFTRSRWSTICVWCGFGFTDGGSPSAASLARGDRQSVSFPEYGVVPSEWMAERSGSGTPGN